MTVLACHRTTDTDGVPLAASSVSEMRRLIQYDLYFWETLQIQIAFYYITAFTTESVCQCHRVGTSDDLGVWHA